MTNPAYGERGRGASLTAEAIAETAYMVLNEVFEDFADAVYHALDNDIDTITEVGMSEDGRTIRHVHKVNINAIT